MKEVHFRKAETKKYAHGINHIREAIAEGGHDPISAMYCVGITGSGEIKRFLHYAEIVKAFDVVDKIAFERLKLIYT